MTNSFNIGRHVDRASQSLQKWQKQLSSVKEISLRRNLKQQLQLLTFAQDVSHHFYSLIKIYRFPRKVMIIIAQSTASVQVPRHLKAFIVAAVNRLLSLLLCPSVSLLQEFCDNEECWSFASKRWSRVYDTPPGNSSYLTARRGVCFISFSTTDASAAAVEDFTRSKTVYLCLLAHCILRGFGRKLIIF